MNAAVVETDQSVPIFNQHTAANDVLTAVITGELAAVTAQMGLESTGGEVRVQVSPPNVAAVPDWYSAAE